MTDQEKTILLIESKTKENNYIAMCLMLNTLGLTFEEAFSKLLLRVDKICFFNLEIGEIRINYDLEFVATVDVPSQWGYMRRRLFVGEKFVEGSFVEAYIDEGQILDMKKGDKMEEIEQIVKDLKDVVPIIKNLFYKV